MRALPARALCVGISRPGLCRLGRRNERGRSCADEKERSKVEIVYINGVIHTMEAAKPVVEAISIGRRTDSRDGKLGGDSRAGRAGPGSSISADEPSFRH